jgi:hypothetical protein
MLISMKGRDSPNIVERFENKIYTTIVLRPKCDPPIRTTKILQTYYNSSNCSTVVVQGTRVPSVCPFAKYTFPPLDDVFSP